MAEIIAEKVDLPDQFIRGSRSKNREAVIIWKGVKRKISYWALKLDITPGTLRDRIVKHGLNEKTMSKGPMRGEYKKRVKKSTPLANYRDAEKRFLYGSLV